MKEGRHTDLEYRISRGPHLPEFIINFAQLNLPSIISHGMRRALEAEYGHNKSDTQSKCFSALKEFSKFLHENQINAEVPLRENVVAKFSVWLDKSSRGLSAQVYMRDVIRILKWCQRNMDGVVSKNINFNVGVIRCQKNTKARESLNESEIKKILEACYCEIEAVELQRSNASRIMSGAAETKNESELYELLSELLILGAGALPTQHVVNRAGHAYARKVSAQGGHRALSEFLWISPRGVLPYYLAILIQSSANPRALLGMTRSPIQVHPLRSDLERIGWMKWRSKAQQVVDFPIGRKWSAPSLVRRLILLNEELVPICRLEDREKLFISRSSTHQGARIPSPSTWNAELDEFIERHALPDFTFKDIRRAGAQLIRGVTGSDKEVQLRLNHRSREMARTYTGTQRQADEFDQIILAHQNRLINSGTSILNESTSSPVNKGSYPSVPDGGAETVFGFRCRNPFDGVAPGSIKGKQCMQFFRCAGCPGAVVPLDDIDVVATLLAACSALEEAKGRSLSEGWWSRYELLYEPTRLVIVTDLIPFVHSAVLDRAKLLMNKRLIPYLD